MLADKRDATDARILALAREGRRRESGRLLVEAYGAEITGTCIGRMGCRASGEDAAQDAMARALVALANYRGSGGLRPWLHRIAANRCIDLLRSNRSRMSRQVNDVAMDTLAEAQGPLPMELAEDRTQRLQELDVMKRHLNDIKEPDRTWLELHYNHGISYDDLAEQACLSRAAVKQRIWRAIKRLRVSMERERRSRS